MILEADFFLKPVLFKDDYFVTSLFEQSRRHIERGVRTDVPVFSDIETVDPDAALLTGESDECFGDFVDVKISPDKERIIRAAGDFFSERHRFDYLILHRQSVVDKVILPLKVDQYLIDSLAFGSAAGTVVDISGVFHQHIEDGA